MVKNGGMLAFGEKTGRNGRGKYVEKEGEVVLSQLMVREWIRMSALAVEFLLGQFMTAIGFGGHQVLFALLALAWWARGGCH